MRNVCVMSVKKHCVSTVTLPRQLRGIGRARRSESIYQLSYYLCAYYCVIPLCLRDVVVLLHFIVLSNSCCLCVKSVVLRNIVVFV